jgi:hypothetical protein
MHEHHHDGAGSTAVLLVNDTFLPDSFGAGVMGGVLHAHHDAHHGIMNTHPIAYRAYSISM